MRRRDFIKAIGTAAAGSRAATRGWLGVAALGAPELVTASAVMGQNAADIPIEIVPQIATSALSFSYSPDGRTIVSGGGSDSGLTLWQAASGRELRTLKGHSEVVVAVAFSPDGRTVLSGSWDKTLKLWDAASGRELRTFKGHMDQVTAVAFSPDGRTVISVSDDLTLKLWDTTSARELHKKDPLVQPLRLRFRRTDAPVVWRGTCTGR